MGSSMIGKYHFGGEQFELNVTEGDSTTGEFSGTYTSPDGEFNLSGHYGLRGGQVAHLSMWAERNIQGSTITETWSGWGVKVKGKFPELHVRGGKATVSTPEDSRVDASQVTLFTRDGS